MFRKPQPSIIVSFALAAVLGLPIAAHAGGLGSSTLNSVTKTGTTVVNGTPLGPSGPTGPNGPLISTPGGSARGNSRVGIGSSNPLRSNPKSAQSKGTAPESRIKGTVDRARLPTTFRKPLQATVTSITNNSVTVTTPTGPATLKLPPGSVSTSRMLVGSKITVTPNANGVSVQLRVTVAAPKPYAGVYVGKVESVAGKAVSLRFRDGALRTFVANPQLLLIIKAAKGKTVALASSDGLSARSLLTSKELDHVLASIPKVQKSYIGRIVNATASAVTLDLGGGQLQTLQCSACAGGALHGASLLPGVAVYVIGDQQGRLLNLAAIPNGTRIVGQITAAQANSVSIMLASGDIVTLPCACTTMLQTIGDINVGDPFIADLDQNAAITSLSRFPDNGQTIGQIVKISAKSLDLKLPNGQVQTFACNCLGGPFDATLLVVGNTVSVGLNSDAQIASITAPAAAQAAAAPAASPNATTPATRDMRRRLPCAKGAQNVSAADAQKGHAPCSQRGQSGSIATLSHGGPYLGIATPATRGCAGQDSSNILLGVHYGRSQVPVHNAAVYVSGPASIALMSPPSGYIELRNVPPGIYRLRVQKAGFGEAGTAQFEVPCGEGVRIEANLRTLPQIVRIIRISKRQVAFHTAAQKQPLNCAYSSKTRQRSAKTHRDMLVYTTSHGYYTCGVRKTRVSKTLRR